MWRIGAALRFNSMKRHMRDDDASRPGRTAGSRGGGEASAMRILWFGRSSANEGGHERVYPREAVRAARPRGDDQVTLALASLPRYCVLLRLRPQDAATAEGWERALAPALGEERAARVVAAAARDGSALITTCPRELAEFYADALNGLALPCAIEPA